MASVGFRWAVKALSPKNTEDKKSIDHAGAGIGYYILSSPSESQKFFVVGYKNFTGELSTGSEWANKYQIEKLNKLDSIRYMNPNKEVNKT